MCLQGSFNAQTFHNSLNLKPMPTWYSAVPTMHVQILQLAQEQVKRGAKLEHGLQLIRNCSAALVPSVAKAIEDALGAVVMPTYAMTESMPFASNPRHGKRKLRSV